MSLLIPDAPTLFLNAKLIDGTGADPVPDGCVQIEGNTITKIGRRADFLRQPERQLPRRGPRGPDADARPGRGSLPLLLLGRAELPDLDLKLPAERTTVYAVKNLELAFALRLHGRRERGRAAPNRRHAS